MEKADIGLIGLAVMGQNLVLNMNDHGFTVAVYNRTVSKVDDFLERKPAKGTRIIGAHSLEEMVGAAQDAAPGDAAWSRPDRPWTIHRAALAPPRAQGDIIIDGGNSNFQDTIRRTDDRSRRRACSTSAPACPAARRARATGPSHHARRHRRRPGRTSSRSSRPIAAKVGRRAPCCDWVGENGAGHYVKMVHNGIEYGDMQLICEAYHLMKKAWA